MPRLGIRDTGFRHGGMRGHLARMLQQWFNLSDPAVEEALYDSLAMRGFVGIDLGREPVPNETTVCKFRHLLEQHEMGRKLFEQVHVHLEKHGIKVAAKMQPAASSTITCSDVP